MNPSYTSSLRRLAAKIFGYGIVAAAKIVTGARSFWHSPPQATPTVYFANHNSHADFGLVWATLPPELRYQTRPVAGADYWLSSPLKRFVGVDVVNALMIAREGSKVRENNPIRQMAATLEAGESLIMFPEGTRNMSEEILLPIKAGIFHLARACPDVRFVPVWIENLQRVLPKGVLVPVPIACTVRYGHPLEFKPGVGKVEFLAQVRTALMELRPAYDRPDEPRAAVRVAAASAITAPAPAPTPSAVVPPASMAATAVAAAASSAAADTVSPAADNVVAGNADAAGGSHAD